MKKMVSIKRDKKEILGLVEFLDNGVTKFARFDKSWSNAKVCEVFDIENSTKEETK